MAINLVSAWQRLVLSRRGESPSLQSIIFLPTIESSVIARWWSYCAAGADGLGGWIMAVQRVEGVVKHFSAAALWAHVGRLRMGSQNWFNSCSKVFHFSFCFQIMMSFDYCTPQAEVSPVTVWKARAKDAWKCHLQNVFFPSLFHPNGTLIFSPPVSSVIAACRN